MGGRENRERRRNGPPLIGVGAVLLSEQLDRVLLIQRGAPPAKGKWSVPGGLVERGERLIAACEREVLEETGLIADLHDQPAKLLERTIHDDDGSLEYHYLIVDFWGHVRGGALCAASDVQRAEWVEIPDLTRLDATAGLDKVVHRAIELARSTPPTSPLLE